MWSGIGNTVRPGASSEGAQVGEPAGTSGQLDSSELHARMDEASTHVKRLEVAAGKINAKKGSEKSDYINLHADQARGLTKVLEDGLRTGRFPRDLDSRSCLAELKKCADKVENLAAGRITVTCSYDSRTTSTVQIGNGNGLEQVFHLPPTRSSGEEARRAFMGEVGREVPPRASDGNVKIIEELLARNPYQGVNDDKAKDYRDRLQIFIRRWPRDDDCNRQGCLEAALRRCMNGMVETGSWDSDEGKSTRALIERSGGGATERQPSRGLPANSTPVLERSEEKPTFDAEAGKKELMALAENNPWPKGHQDHDRYAKEFRGYLSGWDSNPLALNRQVLDLMRTYHHTTKDHAATVLQEAAQKKREEEHAQATLRALAKPTRVPGQIDVTEIEEMKRDLILYEASNPWPKGGPDQDRFATMLRGYLSEWDSYSQAEKEAAVKHMRACHSQVKEQKKSFILDAASYGLSLQADPMPVPEQPKDVQMEAIKKAPVMQPTAPSTKSAAPQEHALPANPTPVPERPQEAPAFDVEAGKKTLLEYARNPYPADHADHADYAATMRRLIDRWDASDAKGKQSVLDTAKNANSYAKRAMT